MRYDELVSWTLDIADRVKRGQRIEDSAVELKAEWPLPEKFARQLAGHANAAGGSDILWIIGLDEKKGVVGADNSEQADHLGSMKACFDSPAPSLIRDATPNVDGMSLQVLLFSTARAPFVVKNPAFGTDGSRTSVAREVPWREGATTRSAKHEDLIRILSPLAALPDIEVLGGTAVPAGRGQLIEVELDLYVDSERGIDLVIPFHRCGAVVSFPGLGPVPSERLRITPRMAMEMRSIEEPMPPPRSLSPAIIVTEDEIFIAGPGKLLLRSRHRLGETAIQLIGKADGEFFATLRAKRAARPLAVSARLVYKEGTPSMYRQGATSPTWRAVTAPTDSSGSQASL